MPFNVDPGVQQAPKWRIDAPRPDTSSAVLAEGVGNVVDGIVNTLDQNNVDQITKTIRKEYELDNRIFGVDGASTMESSTQVADKMGTDTPQGIKTAQQQLLTAKEAVQQGRLRESNYQSRLTAVMRQLRAEYPGYQDQIDQIATRITGENPEHATRRALMQEWQSDAKAAQGEAARKQKNIEQWGESGWLPVGWEKMDYNELQGQVFKRRAMDADISRQKSNLELKAAQGKQAQQDGLDLASQFARNTAAIQFDDTLKGMGVNSWDDLYKKIEGYKADGVIDAQEAQQISQVFDRLQQNANTAFNSFLQKPLSDAPGSKSLEAIIQDKDKVENIRSMSMRELDQMKQNFIEGKLGLFAMNKTYHDNLMDGTALEMAKNNPTLLMLNGLSRVGGKEAVDAYIRLHPEALLSLDNKSKGALQHTQLDAIVNGKDAKTGLQNIQNEKGVDPSVKGEYIKSLVAMVKDKNASPQMIQNITKSLYGPGNLDFMSTAPLNDNDKEIAFHYLTSPEMSQFMFKNRASDPEGWSNYRRWVAASSQSLYGQAANTLQSYIVDKDTPYSINFDGTRFVLNGTDQVDNSNLGDMGVPSSFARAYPIDLKRAVDKVNIGLMNAMEVTKLSGEDPQQVFKAFTNGLRLDLSSKKNPTMWDTLRMQMQNLWQPSGTNSDKAKGGAQKLGFNDAAGALAKMASPVADAIQLASNSSGIDVNDLAAMAYIESSGRPGPEGDTGSYKGLFQLSASEFDKWKQRPDADIYNPQDNALAFGAKLKAERETFKTKYGRDPNVLDTYLVHQQGEGGYAKHMANPNGTAWENMYSTGEGKRRGEAWSKDAIWKNIPDYVKANFPGGVDTVTSEAFVQIQKNRIQELGVDPIDVKSVSGDTKGIKNDVLTRLTSVQDLVPFDIKIRSGARDPTTNEKVGGAHGSEHLSGNAADIDLKGLSDEQRTQLVSQLVKSGFNRIGAYSGNTGLHVDMKDQRQPDGSPWPMFDRTKDNMDKAPSWFTKGLAQGWKELQKTDLAKKTGEGSGIMGLNLNDLVGKDLSLTALPSNGEGARPPSSPFSSRAIAGGRESNNIEDRRGLKEGPGTLEELLQTIDPIPTNKRKKK